ncbi:hypothetical protein [Alicyclobacillus fodiniaquatilis]|uniref:Uncharacterized protein n=1 Tax=Alicyclobacillus fodiniaquatilis TaxID=1661150 RepID=A0ABW4JEQ8_9BACL
MWRLITSVYWLGMPKQPVNPRIFRSVKGWFDLFWSYDIHPTVFFLVLLALIGLWIFAVVDLVRNNSKKSALIVSSACLIVFCLLWQWETHAFLTMPAQLTYDIIKTVLLILPMVVVLLQRTPQKPVEKEIADLIATSKLL